MENNIYTHNPQPRDPEHHQPKENEDLQRKNKMLTYALIGVAALLAIGAIVYFAGRKNDRKEPEKNQVSIAVTDSLKTDSLKSDSLKVSVSHEGEDGYDEYEPYSENYVIANEAYLRTAPSETSTAGASKLKFGDKMYVDNSYTGSKYKKVYFSQPSTTNPQTPYFVTDYVLTYQSEFEEFKKYFSLKPFAGLATKTKKLILDSDYSNSRQYYLTQNLERSKSAICYGDFDSDGLMDVAVLLDNNEDQYSRLLIICTNAATQDPYLAYAENYTDKMRINSFKKAAKVYLNTGSLVPSPADGVILNAADVKIAIVYDRANQKFKSYYQSAVDEYSEATEASE